MSVSPTTTEIINAACAVVAAFDTTANVIPYWLPIKEGDSCDDLRSDLDVVDDERQVHGWMVDATSPSTSRINKEYFEGLDEDELEGQTVDQDAEITLKLGMVRAHRQGTDADNSARDCVELKDAAEEAFARRPKLSLPGVTGHTQLQLVSVSFWQSAEALCHVYLFVLKVKVRRTITFE